MNKKNIFTLENQFKGEYAMNNLNVNAFYMYSNLNPLLVYKYEKNGNTLYATKGCYEFKDVSFEFLEEFFNAMYEEEIEANS